MAACGACKRPADFRIAASSSYVLACRYSHVPLTLTCDTCAQDHTLAVTQGGDLWTWGKGDDGALGLNAREHRLAPERVGGIEFFGARVVQAAAGSCKNGASGSFHSACITEDGSIWTW